MAKKLNLDELEENLEDDEWDKLWELINKARNRKVGNKARYFKTKKR